MWDWFKVSIIWTQPMSTQIYACCHISSLGHKHNQKFKMIPRLFQHIPQVIMGILFQIKRFHTNVKYFPTTWIRFLWSVLNNADLSSTTNISANKSVCFIRIISCCWGNLEKYFSQRTWIDPYVKVNHIVVVLCNGWYMWYLKYKFIFLKNLKYNQPPGIILPVQGFLPKEQ